MPPRPPTHRRALLPGALLAVAAVAALGTFSPVSFAHLSAAYPVGMASLRACPLAAQMLGPELDQTWGRSSVHTGAAATPWAWFDLSVAGSRRRGHYHFAASREASGWTLVVGELTTEGRTIDVARCLDATPGLPAPLDLPPAFASVAALPAMPLVAPGAASGLAVLAAPPPGLTGVALTEFYCQNGLPAVCSAAALAHLHGAGVPRNPARARELLDAGCAAHAPDACAERARLPP